MMIALRYLIPVLSILIFVNAVFCDSQEETITLHTSSVNSLQCVTCAIEVTDNNLKLQNTKKSVAEFLRYGDRIKCVTKNSDSTETYASDGKNAHYYSVQNLSGGKTAYGATLMPLNRQEFSNCDPWCAGLLSLSLPNTVEYVSLKDMIAKAQSVEYVSEEKVGSFLCSKIALKFDCDSTLCRDQWLVEIWLSKSHGMLVKKCHYSTTLLNGSKQLLVDEVTDFLKLPSGNFFPKAIHFSTTIDNIPIIINDVRIENVRTPSSIAMEKFRISYHNPTPFTNHFRQTFYTIDESGNRISPEKPIGVATIETTEDQKTPSNKDTKDEPVDHIPRLLVGVSLTCLIGIFIIARRNRNNRGLPNRKAL